MISAVFLIVCFVMNCPYLLLPEEPALLFEPPLNPPPELLLLKLELPPELKLERLVEYELLFLL